VAWLLWALMVAALALAFWVTWISLQGTALPIARVGVLLVVAVAAGAGSTRFFRRRT